MSKTNTTNRKPTKRSRFAELLAIPAVAANPELVEFINHEVELLDKKNSAERKPTEKQVANEGIKVAILDLLAAHPNRLFTIGEIIKEAEGMPEDMTPQRASALLRQMEDEVVKTYEKRKAYFAYKAE